MFLVLGFAASGSQGGRVGNLYKPYKPLNPLYYRPYAPKPYILENPKALSLGSPLSPGDWISTPLLFSVKAEACVCVCACERERERERDGLTLNPKPYMATIA